MPKEKIESYILQMECNYEEIGEGLWIIHEGDINGSQKLVISYSDDIVHFRLKVMDIPKKDKILKEFFKKLLELNATSLTHGAFAVEESAVVLIDSLQCENLDFNEFQASVDALFLGAIETYSDLEKYIEKQSV